MGTDITGREIERACAGNFLDGLDAFCIALQRIKMAEGYGVNDYRDALTPISTRCFRFLFLTHLLIRLVH